MGIVVAGAPAGVAGIEPIEIIGWLPPAFELVYDYRSPLFYTYEGDAEVCWFSFDMLGVVPDSLVIRASDFFADALAKERSQLLSLRLWKKGDLIEKWRGEIIATASPIAWAYLIPMAIKALIKVAPPAIILSLVGVVLDKVYKVIWGATVVEPPKPEGAPDIPTPAKPEIKLPIPPIVPALGAGAIALLALVFLLRRK